MTLSIDGSNTASNTTSVSITTTKTNNIILLFTVGESNDPVTAVSDGASLTWNHRVVNYTLSAPLTSNNILAFDLWWAFSSGILTNDTITVTGNASDGRLMVMAVNGANTTTPFDTNASNSAANCMTSNILTTSLSITNSTDAANTMLIDFIRTEQTLSTGLAGLVPASGFTQVISGGTFTSLYSKILTSTQSSVAETFSWTNNNPALMCLTAIQGASTGSFTRPSLLNGLGGGGLPYINPLG